MKIYGMLLVKDEADIIRYTLADMQHWIDKVFILDNGSTDGTWEILQELQNEKVVIWKRVCEPYRRTMRTEIFNHFRGISKSGDWWYYADSDEFCVDNPREFLCRVPHCNHFVYKKSIDYFLTHEDIEEYSFSGDFSEDRKKIRYIKPNCWSEIRFFRYRERMIWPLHEEKPRHMGVASKRPIIMKHYQFRSPEQMQKRIDIRNKIPRNAEGGPFKHSRQSDWRSLLRNRSDLCEDQGYEQYLSLPVRRNLRENPLKRVGKILLHTTGILP